MANARPKISIPDELWKTSRDLVVQSAKWALDRGYPVVRVDHGDKSVMNIDSLYLREGEWKPPKLDDFRAGGMNVGVITGPKRHGPTDVDHDCVESLTFGPLFLPHTETVFGRNSKPKSHKLYTHASEHKAVESYKYADPIRNDTLVEFRSDMGGPGNVTHTNLPGSIHPCGELVTWTDKIFAEPAEVDPIRLKDATRMVALAVLISRHVWRREDKGTRHDRVRGLCGLLARLGLEEHETEKLLRAVGQYVGDVDDGRLHNVRTTYARLREGRPIHGVTELKKHGPEVIKVVERIQEWFGNNPAAITSDMNDRFACVSFNGRFRVVDTDVPPGERPVVMSKDDFLDSYSNQLVQAQDGKLVSKARVWLASPSRLWYPRVEFLPGVDDPPKDVFNLWRGWAVEPNPSPHGCDAWLDLVWDVICGRDDRVYDWLMNWLAHLIQFPTTKAHTCPVIVGVQGAGKSMMASYLAAILGSAYLVVSKSEHVQGRFNNHVRHTLLLHSDEALFANDKKHRAVIKSLITEEAQFVEAKGLDATSVRSYVRLLLTSNYDHAAPAEEKDRRFTLINMKDRKVSPRQRDRVLAEIKKAGPASLLHVLQTMVVNPTMANCNIKNSDWTQNVLNHTDPVVNWWYERLQMGQIVNEYLRWATRPSNEMWPRIVGLEAMYRLFLEETRALGRFQSISKAVFSNKINDLTGGKRSKHMTAFFPPVTDDTVPRVWRDVPGGQKAILDMPSLQNCRYAFERFMDHPIDWDDSDVNIMPDDKPNGPEY